MNELIPFAIPIITAGVEALKRIFGLSGLKVNGLAVVIGIGIVAANAYVTNVPLDVAAIPGVVTGLAAGGLYGVVKNLLTLIIETPPVPVPHG